MSIIPSDFVLYLDGQFKEPIKVQDFTLPTLRFEAPEAAAFGWDMGQDPDLTEEFVITRKAYSKTFILDDPYALPFPPGVKPSRRSRRRWRGRERAHRARVKAVFASWRRELIKHQERQFIRALYGMSNP